MKALIVYDSTYGNTEKITQAIKTAFAGNARALRAAEVKPPDLESIDLLIVGSPTQGFRPTQSVQTFIDTIPGNTLNKIKVAAFDTRFHEAETGRALRFIIKAGGYAAPRIAKKLTKKGGNLVTPPEGFFVKDREGPLAEGEIERAALWGKRLQENAG